MKSSLLLRMLSEKAGVIARNRVTARKHPKRQIASKTVPSFHDAFPLMRPERSKPLVLYGHGPCGDA